MLTGRACAVLAEPVVVGRAVAENGVWRGTAAVPIAAEEPVFAGHFEDFPIFPGMCVLECAHRGALAIAPAEFGDGRLTAIESARFTAPVYPGDTLTVEVEWRDAGERWYCAAGARVAAREVAVLRLAYLPGGAP
ncbi:3-hydroxyacyl-ACP dehydratase FabZ family protein [Amycolatopsis sp. CA-230715]|uniref:3-hydroxyacyl-ACP dehydratase FabZ family protein n=1 Tax=Amycolatopsis sp. CA-230715 TaxID=2745196 RepID=UPI001C011270|nr:MaoC/PaaZ C-terminal domain-containing protein [Amycolatopsis sp. CA-230715]QWF84497.1 hypothetical protein HUW46_07947 [Amycolatopsis sp. CA-230715]